MHLFIKYAIFHNYWPKFGPRFWDIFSISGNALMNHFFSFAIPCKKGENTVLWGFCESDAPFHQNSILKHHFWPNFRPRCWDIFSISGNALMNPFFSIVISCEKAINDCVRFCGSDAPFIKDSIFHNFSRKFTPRFKDIFSISGNKLMELLLQHRNILPKSEIRLCESLRKRYTFSPNSIFHNLLPKFRPRFWDIFSISGNALMNPFFSIVISCEKAKNDCVRFYGSDATIKDSIFHNYWINFGPRFWEYFLNFRKCAYESLLQLRNTLQKSEIRLCEVLRIRCTFSSKIQFFIIFGPRYWDILAQILRYFLNFRNALWITSSAP